MQNTTWDTTVGWIMGYRDFTVYDLSVFYDKINEIELFKKEVNFPEIEIINEESIISFETFINIFFVYFHFISLSLSRRMSNNFTDTINKMGVHVLFFFGWGLC